jgi:hypothetical protein
MLAVNSPRKGKIPFNITDGQIVFFLADKNDNASLFLTENLSCKKEKNECKCTSTQFSDWQITFTKYFPDGAKPLPQMYILEGTFSGSLTKEQNAPCDPVKVGFSGKFKLKSYFF